MFNTIIKSITPHLFNPFFNVSGNRQSELRTGPPFNRPANYEDDLRNVIMNPIIAADPYFHSGVGLNGANTHPAVLTGIVPDSIKCVNNHFHTYNGLNYNLLSHNVHGPILEYTEFGHNYITQPVNYPVNKIITDYWKVMRTLSEVNCFGLFYHCMMITDPITINPVFAHHVNDTYNVIPFVPIRNNLLPSGFTEGQGKLNNILKHILDFVSVLKTKLYFVTLPYTDGTIEFETHFIVVGPLTIFDKDKVRHCELHVNHLNPENNQDDFNNTNEITPVE